MIPALVTAFVMLDADQRDVERMPSVCVQDQPDDQIVGPDSIKDHHVLFNIVAQAPPDIPRDKLREMALTLLTWRFQLGLHRETRELRYLALVIDKGGSKMARDERGRFRRSRNCSSGQIEYWRVSGQTLTVLLTRFTQQPILDMTGLKGQSM